jgi:hypothetical protein
MQPHYPRLCIVALTLLIIGASEAAAQRVTFTNLSDAVPGKFFDGRASRPDATNPNRLIVRFNTGSDPLTWQTNDFRAATGTFTPRNATDTLQFTVTAPAGYYIAFITYSQRGIGSVLRSGSTNGASMWSVGGRPLPLKFFGTNPTLTGTADLRAMRWTVVPVMITTSLSAHAPPQLGSASLAVTGADVLVTLAKF